MILIKRTYILLEAIEAETLNIGTELMIKRSSCSMRRNNIEYMFQFEDRHTN